MPTEPLIQKLDLHSNTEDFEDYMEKFEILIMTRIAVKDDKLVARSFAFIGKDTYSLQ